MLEILQSNINEVPVNNGNTILETQPQLNQIEMGVNPNKLSRKENELPILFNLPTPSPIEPVVSNLKEIKQALVKSYIFNFVFYQHTLGD